MADFPDIFLGRALNNYKCTFNAKFQIHKIISASRGWGSRPHWLHPPPLTIQHCYNTYRPGFFVVLPAAILNNCAQVPNTYATWPLPKRAITGSNSVLITVYDTMAAVTPRFPNDSNSTIIYLLKTNVQKVFSKHCSWYNVMFITMSLKKKKNVQSKCICLNDKLMFLIISYKIHRFILRNTWDWKIPYAES